jgi:DeoR family transcriptional regulator, deoxyribose operon repressor
MSMTKAKVQRITRLFSSLGNRRAVHLTDAAKMLQVSEMTIRRDVAASGARLVCLGGYVVRGPFDCDAASANRSPNGMDSVLDLGIALLAHGDTIFLDSGEALATFAQRLPSQIALTVVCYSLDVATALRHKPNVRMVLLGGHYMQDTATLSSGEGIATLRTLCINKAFMSADGADPARGVTCAHFYDATIKQLAMANAVERHLIVHSTRFGRIGPICFARLSDFDSVISDLPGT